MTQLEVVPLGIVEYRPHPRQHTAHALGRALAEDGNYYIVKGNRNEAHVCATEWACNSIADSLNLPVANSKVLQGENGELLYGALEVAPKLPEIEVARALLGTSGNDLYIPQLVDLLSSTYALDLVIGNLDRHEENFIIATGTLDAVGQRIGHLRLIDFGSSDLLQAKKVALPFPKNSNTVRLGQQIRARHGFAHAAAESLLSRLREGRRFIVDRAMFGMPPQWLSNVDRTAFAEWVHGSGFDDRLRQIEDGLRNGTHL